MSQDSKLGPKEERWTPKLRTPGYVISCKLVGLDDCEGVLVRVAFWVEEVLGKVQSGIFEKVRAGEHRSILVDGLGIPSTKSEKIPAVVDLDGYLRKGL